MNFVTSIPDSFNPSDCSPEQLLHDLQVRQVDLEFKLIELEVQNEHLRSTQTQHEQSDGYYADLFNNAPVGHLTLTENELISEANIAATEFFGIERHNLLSRRFASLVAADHGDRWYLLFAQLIKHNQAVDIELTLKNNQGRQLPVQLNCLSVNATVRISITDISNIKQAETVLRDVEETVAIQTERLQPLKAQEDLLCRFQEIARSVPGVIYQYRLRPDGSSCIPYASDALFDFFRLRPEEVREDASKAYALIHPDDCEGFIASIQASARDLTPWYYEYRIKFDDGTVRWLLANSRPQREADGSTLWHGFTTDITERRLSDQVLNQLKAMVDISLDGFYIVDQKGQLTQVNAAYAQMLGYSAEELTGMHLNQLDAIEDDEQIKAHIEKVIEQGFDFFETPQFHKNGHEIELEVSVSYLADYQRFCVFCRDITQRKTMELALKLSESKFRSIINASPIAMALVNTSVKQAEFVFLSPSFVKTFGYDLAESSTLEEWNSKAYPDPDYRARVKAMEQKLRESEHDDITPLEITICCKDNSYKTVLASYTSIDNDSKAMGLVVLYDITDRKQVEAQYNSIFNASVEGIITVNIDNIVVASNPAVETIFGYSADELVNGTLQKLLPSLSDNSHKLSLDYPQPLIVKIQEIQGLHKNGHLITLDLTIADYTIDNNAYFTYIVRDITERKHREQQHKEHLDQLAHVGRLGLMGEMASGMAHEVNQPLTAIATYAQVSLNLIKKEKPDLQKLIEIAVKTQEQALRAGHIIHGMKRFCKSKAQQRSIININELINNSVKLCADQLKQNRIVVTFKLEEPLPVINVDPIQIEQVLINLIRNGADAILSATEKIQRKITIHSQLTPNHEIKVSVQDNGSGIPDDQREKILMPFHTSKSEGMGMGLSISSALIEAHNGKLNFESHFGKGSTFYFTLPI